MPPPLLVLLFESEEFYAFKTVPVTALLLKPAPPVALMDNLGAVLIEGIYPLLWFVFVVEAKG